MIRRRAGWPGLFILVAMSLMAGSVAARSRAPVAFSPTQRSPGRAQLHVRVVVLAYNPWLASKGKTLFAHESDVQIGPHADKIRQDLAEASSGFVDLEIVDTIERSEFPPEEDGGRLDESEYLELRSRGEGYYQRYGVRVDIARMIRENGLDQRVKRGEIDEVWYFGSWTYSSLESYMAGPGAFPVNGGLFSADSGRAFVVMFMENARGPGLHAIGHRVESTLDRAYGWIGEHQDTPWARFRRHPRLPADWMVGTPMGVGDMHNPPNAREDYDYSNDQEVQSTAEDWLNFPFLSGKTTTVSARTWGSTDLGYERWWFSHLPNAGGVSARADSEPNAMRQNNWWKYMFDMSRYHELVEEDVLPLAVIASPGEDLETASPVSFTGYGVDQTRAGARVTRLVWDFGDGSPATAETVHLTRSDPSVVQHAYVQPGTYRVELQAEDARGRKSSPVSAEVRYVVIAGAAPSPGPSGVPSETARPASRTPTREPGTIVPTVPPTTSAPRGYALIPLLLHRASISELHAPATAVPSGTPPPRTPSATSPPIATSTPADDDGMVFVPAGEFLMGAPAGDPDGREPERPQHSVQLDAYWIDTTEVTNAMFERFVADSGYRTAAERKGTSYAFADGCHGSDVVGADWRHPRGPGSDIVGMDDHPVVHVSWLDAGAYCQWRGSRLPTEAEWEKAAGAGSRKYPWGSAQPRGSLLNFADVSMKDCLSFADTSTNDGFALTAPVGRYPEGISPHGAVDMAGNVWEWVADWYDANYYGDSPRTNPRGPQDGTQRGLRGGAFTSYAVWDTRTASRNAGDPDSSAQVVGFRCAR